MVDHECESLRLLRQLEWAVFDDRSGDHLCPECDASQYEGKGHRDYCRLARIIGAEVRGT